MMKTMRTCWILIVTLLACGGGDDAERECVPGDSQGTLLCSSEGQWKTRSLVESTGGDGGECHPQPGTYVVSYRITSSSCDVDALPDEVFTVTPSGTAVGLDGQPPDGCVDSTPYVEGCFVSYTRSCNVQTAYGRAELTGNYQFDLIDGGFTRIDMRLYEGSVMTDACAVTQQISVRRQ